MKETLYVLMITLLALQSTGQETDSLTVSKQEIKAFFRDTWQGITGGVTYFNIYEEPLETRISSRNETDRFLHVLKFDSFFVKSDVDFILAQVKESKAIIWDSSYIDNAKFLNRRIVDNALHSAARGARVPVYYRMSIPIFSKDKTICYMETWYWCGPLCGQGKNFIFKFIHNHWELFRVYNGPVS